MTSVSRTIKRVELRVQWHGSMGHFYDGKGPGFPGAEVPMELASMLTSLVGSTVEVDPKAPGATAGQALKKVFDAYVGKRGPGGKARWALFGAYSETRTTDGKKWEPGMNLEGIAFELGTRKLTHELKPDPQAKDERYVKPYVDGTKKLDITYWLCFELTQEES